MEKIVDMANQNVKKCTQEISRHQKSRTWEDTETINELREDFNKNQVKQMTL
jgi:uncharacterized spore protein YtfJ